MTSLLIALASCSKVDDSIGDFKAQFVKPDENIMYDKRGLPTPSNQYTEQQKQQAQATFSKKLDPSAAYEKPKPLQVQPKNEQQKQEENVSK